MLAIVLTESSHSQERPIPIVDLSSGSLEPAGLADCLEPETHLGQPSISTKIDSIAATLAKASEPLCLWPDSPDRLKGSASRTPRDRNMYEFAQFVLRGAEPGLDPRVAELAWSSDLAAGHAEACKVVAPDRYDVPQPMFLSENSRKRQFLIAFAKS